MANIRKAIADIAVANGYEGGEPQTIISALDALTDTLAGDDEDAGKSVNEAINALAPYIGGGGGEFGSILYMTQSTTAPKAGDDASAFSAADIARIGTSAEKVLADVRGSAVQGGFASGLYLTFMPEYNDCTDCAGFIVTVSTQGVVETSVQSDLTFTLEVVEGYNSFGFTVPELQSGEYLVLVPSKGE